jgi:hypothetical protein
MDSNFLDSLLDLEEQFYNEGYDLGVSDGAHAGYTEGAVFAVEKGFEKFIEMGRLYGKALVWAQRLADSSASKKLDRGNETKNGSTLPQPEVSLDPAACREMEGFPPGSRLAKNINTLLELADPASLVMQNTEEAVTDVDERLKGATIKAKLIQRSLGEREDTSDIHPDAKEPPTSGDGSGSIEDISALNIRGH